MTASRPIRVLVAKAGLDGHDRGAKVVAQALRDAGCAVTYTGLHKTVDQVADAAAAEDVDVIGLSVLSGAQLTLFPELVEALAARGLKIPVFGGGIIPAADREVLLEAGVKAVFGPGTSLTQLTDWVIANAPRG